MLFSYSSSQRCKAVCNSQGKNHEYTTMAQKILKTPLEFPSRNVLIAFQDYTPSAATKALIIVEVVHMRRHWVEKQRLLTTTWLLTIKAFVYLEEDIVHKWMAIGCKPCLTRISKARFIQKSKILHEKLFKITFKKLLQVQDIFLQAVLAFPPPPQKNCNSNAKKAFE